MKKLYALLLALLPLTLSAQTITLTVDGQEVKNGETKTFVYAEDEHDLFPEDMPGLFFLYGIFPKIMVTCSADQTVTGYVTDLTKTATVQCCWAGGCETTSLNHATITKSADMKAGEAQDMQIEVQTKAHSETAYEYSIGFKFENENEDVIYESTVVLTYAPKGASISGINASQKDARIFNLRGQQLQSLQKGVNIVGGRKILK